MAAKKILHHLFFGVLAYFSAGMVMSMFVMGAELGIPPIPFALFGMAAFLVTSGKIITYRYRSHFQKPGGSGWQKRFFMPALWVFLLLLVITAIYMLEVDVTAFLSSPPDGMTEEEFFPLRHEASRSLWILILGCLFIWFLFLHLLLTGKDRIFPRSLLRFAARHVSVYLVYRLAMFLVNLVGALLFSLGKGGMAGGYFNFVMDDGLVQLTATGSLSDGGTFLSGMTGAAAFFILSLLAEEFLSKTENSTFLQRFKNMFLTVDTAKLFVLTVACILVNLISSADQVGFFGSILSFFLVVLWVISLVLFVADTRILAYLMNFAAMNLVERLVPMPDGDGFAIFLLALLATLARIALFAMIALMMGNYQLFKQYQIDYAKTHNLPLTVSDRLVGITFLDALVFILCLSEEGFRSLLQGKVLQRYTKAAKFVVDLSRKIDDGINRFLQKLQPKPRTKQQF